MKPLVVRPFTRFTLRAFYTLAYRGLVVYLLVVILLWLERTSPRPPVPVEPARAEAAWPRAELIDVSRSAARGSIVELLGLRRGERVIAIDDRPASTDDVVDAWRLAVPGDYLDLTVTGAHANAHRVLVLVHP